MAFLDETPDDKYEAEMISVDYIIFSDFKIIPLWFVLNHNQLGPKGPMPHGKELTSISMALRFMYIIHLY